MSGFGLSLEKIENETFKVTPSHVSFGCIYLLFAFSCAFALLCFAFFLLCWYFLKKTNTSYKPGCGGFGGITNREPVVGGLFSCGKPQPILTFVSDEVATRMTETRLQSLTLWRELTENVLTAPRHHCKA